ncbi:MAG TPA: DUF2784 domain-containing protein [Thioalkalivibrio sp.]|nr:DUF2784 domain-containing protein [Thioalkalivibrio sp.]
MSYSLLADGVLLLHLAFVLFVIFGGLLSLRNHLWALLHVPVFVWGAMVNLMHWVCPLTPVEQQLRRLAGEEGCVGGFIAHYVGAVVYPDVPAERLGLLLGLAALAWNAGVYAFVWRWRRRRLLRGDNGY